MKEVLKFERVEMRYHTKNGETVAVKDLSFSVKQGEFLAVVGPSGCGKTTLLSLAAGLLKPSAGKIENGGVTFGYMLQKDELFPWRTIEKNVFLPLEIQRRNTPERRQKVLSLAEKYGLKDFLKSFPRELSGGMRQRAAFARTVLTGSDLLLLDEPFSALDYLTRISMREWLLEQWEREKKTVLFITHDVEEAVFLSSRILVVEESPITHLRSIDVPAEYPRSRDELRKPEILSLKEELIGMLRKETS